MKDMYLQGIHKGKIYFSPGDEKACIDKKTPGTYTYRPRPVCLQSEKETKALCDSISSGHLKWGGSGK